MIGITIVAIAVMGLALAQFCGDVRPACTCGSCLSCRAGELERACTKDRDDARRGGDWQRYEFMQGVRKDIPSLNLEGIRQAQERVDVYKQTFGAVPSPTPGSWAK